MKRFLFVTITLLLISLTSFETAQSQNYELIRKQLQQQQNRTRLELRQLQDLLKTYKTQIDEKEQRTEELKETFYRITREITLRDQVIDKLESESQSILKEIDLTQTLISQKKDTLGQLKENYKTTLRYLYKHGQTSDLALILTAENFNQLLTRSYYLKKFEAFRANQAQKIVQATEDLSAKEQELLASKEQNKEVLAEQQREKLTLDKKRKQQENIIATLRQDRKRLNRLLTETRDEVGNLNSTLSQLIAREDVARKRAEEEALQREREAELASANGSPNTTTPSAGNRSPSSNSVESNTLLSEEEFSSLESSFQKQKGTLPWPVENGVISARYGNKVHPVYQTKVPNHGVEIATEPRSHVYAIHDGVVFGVVPIPGYGDVIIVNHGRYNTVYGNLSEVYVQKNTYIKAGDLVALSGDEDSPKGAAVYLMIREKNNNLNPESWIVRK